MIEITQVNASLDEAGDESACLIVGKRVAKRVLRCKDSEIKSIELHRKSIDARKKRDVHFILSFRVELTSSRLEQEVVDRVAERNRSRIRMVDGEAPSFPNPVPNAPKGRPVVVGAGCAGLFAALTLAEAGLKPLLIERGDPAFRRSHAIDLFLKERILDPESNIQFGLGGAGTFSDGKLNTGTKNPAHRLILETFVEAGAPRDILWDAKPHIGSDILPAVVTSISQRIEQLGGTVRYRTKLVDIHTDTSGAIVGIDIQSSHDATSESINTKHLILACGHSARDVFEVLKTHDVALAQKTFAMGVRIEHPQCDIDRAQYGPAAGHPALGAAPYKLVTHLPNGRSVFSFCMCPGGQVVAASSEPGHLCVNGASLNARAGRNANAALLVNVTPDDLPSDDPLAGVELQRICERAAYHLGGSNWNAPAQLVGDFLAERASTTCGKVKPTYPLGVTWTAIDESLPQHIIESLRLGIPLLGKKLRGYDHPDAVLTGVETRSSSPVTVTRDRQCHAVSTPGLYPCGEGAGYAGGIMSAATDGIRCAEAIIADL
ncbi:NAD(P)/FAD-dependent oxidoreductase [Collinsella aerofaciens]|uniref:NAD(P)/FAD-dependent oxidoreductase n=1 Tax=Collinsella aerofaciens TaxID=74426 RepID=UPI003568C79D